jgi:glutathione S-transferase
MKLYYDPISTTCRAITFFLADAGITVELEPLDLFAGQNLSPEFSAINPNQLVPVLVDGDFVLNESSAILKYLAETAGSPAYPATLKPRAQVNAAMDWFNTQVARDLGGCLVYPQVLPAHHMPPMEPEAMLVYGRHQAERWLTILDRHMLGDRPFVCGGAITLADYLGFAHVTLAELVDFDVSPWPNVCRWIAVMKARPGWAAAHAGFNGWIASQRASAA